MKRTVVISRLSWLQIRLLPLHRMPRKIGKNGIVLRPLKLMDRFALSQLDIMENYSGHFRTLRWWTEFRCRFMLKRMFPLAYAIEKGARVVGFTGLYDIRTGRSAEMSLWLKEGERRQGTGTCAADLLICASGSSGLVRELVVKIEPDNEAAYSFWLQQGFSRISGQGYYLVMKKAIMMGTA